MISVLPTPAALVDLDRLEQNALRMSERMLALGVRLRPHVKTHKCVPAARLQVRGHFGGITVSTLAEARTFAAAGFRDLTYAFPVAPARLPEIGELARKVDRLSICLDHEATLAALEDFGNATRVRLGVYLEVDSGDHRGGVDPQSEESVRLARRLATSPGVDFRGLLTHAGQAYRCRGPAEIRQAASEERDVLVELAARLRGEGLECPDLSVGSTPTMRLVDHLDGISEARPGNYAFFDAFQVRLGVCSWDEVAFSVLTTVVGRYPSQNKIMVDAGALALSKDEGPRHLDPQVGCGEVFTADLTLRLPHFRIFSLSQEHGQIKSDRALAAEEHPVGSRLRIVPNHSCLAAALFERYYVVRGDRVVDEWRPTRGW